MAHDFDFYVGGIEDGMIAALQPLKKSSLNGYAQTIDSYGGQLEEETLREALSNLPGLPAILVAYGDGDDEVQPATTPNEPRIIQHDCTFTVICCTDDARGQKARRRGEGAGVGVYKMLGDVRRKLSGLRFRKIVEGEAKPVLLTYDPLTPSGVQFMQRLQDLTAYAQHFDTYFKWTEPDRRQDGTPVTELFFDLNTMNVHEDSSNLPGVTLK